MKSDLMKVKKYNDLAKTLSSLGYSERCNGGSHHVWSKTGAQSLSVPAHNSKSEIAPGTLRNIIKLIKG